MKLYTGIKAWMLGIIVLSSVSSMSMYAQDSIQYNDETPTASALNEPNLKQVPIELESIEIKSVEIESSEAIPEPTQDTQLNEKQISEEAIIKEETTNNSNESIQQTSAIIDEGAKDTAKETTITSQVENIDDTVLQVINKDISQTQDSDKVDSLVEVETNETPVTSEEKLLDKSDKTTVTRTQQALETNDDPTLTQNINIVQSITHGNVENKNVIPDKTTQNISELDEKAAVITENITRESQEKEVKIEEVIVEDKPVITLSNYQQTTKLTPTTTIKAPNLTIADFVKSILG